MNKIIKILYNGQPLQCKCGHRHFRKYATKFKHNGCGTDTIEAMVVCDACDEHCGFWEYGSYVIKPHEIYDQRYKWVDGNKWALFNKLEELVV